MKANALVYIIGAVLIILFLFFVFYYKSQWLLIEHEKPEETGNQKNISQGVGQVRFQILPKNETNCTDAIDNDRDNLTDCSDADCYMDEVCKK